MAFRAFVLAKTSVRPPQTLFTFIMLVGICRTKYSKIYVCNFRNKITDSVKVVKKASSSIRKLKKVKTTT